MALRKIFPTPAGRNSQSGFSVIELMVVVIITAIMTGIVVFSFRSNKRSYIADDEATKVLSFFREAYQRALSQRQAQRITIDLNNRLIKLADMGLLPGGDETIINRGVLNTGVTMTQPIVSGNPLAPPPVPYNYAPADLSSGTIDIYFLADGSITNTTGFNNSSFAPVSLTFFFSPSQQTVTSPDQTSNNAGNLIRAVTLFGPTGSTRVWRFDTNAFVWEIN
jgi:prepilin-type N-terminal cleavage/methylation domain-containing protein